MFRPHIVLALAAAAVVTGAVGAVAVRAGTSVSPVCSRVK